MSCGGGYVCGKGGMHSASSMSRVSKFRTIAPTKMFRKIKAPIVTHEMKNRLPTSSETIVVYSVMILNH